LYKAMSRVLNQDPLNCITGNTTILVRSEAAAAKPAAAAAD
jgi:hypothetical protein